MAPEVPQPRFAQASKRKAFFDVLIETLMHDTPLYKEVQTKSEAKKAASRVAEADAQAAKEADYDRDVAESEVVSGTKPGHGEEPEQEVQDEKSARKSNSDNGQMQKKADPPAHANSRKSISSRKTGHPPPTPKPVQSIDVHGASDDTEPVRALTTPIERQNSADAQGRNQKNSHPEQQTSGQVQVTGRPFPRPTNRALFYSAMGTSKSVEKRSQTGKSQQQGPSSSHRSMPQAPGPENIYPRPISSRPSLPTSVSQIHTGKTHSVRPESSASQGSNGGATPRPNGRSQNSPMAQKWEQARLSPAQTFGRPVSDVGTQDPVRPNADTLRWVDMRN